MRISCARRLWWRNENGDVLQREGNVWRFLGVNVVRFGRGRNEARDGLREGYQWRFSFCGNSCAFVFKGMKLEGYQWRFILCEHRAHLLVKK